MARLGRDNLPNPQVTMGPAVGLFALRFGSCDFGLAMVEENVVGSVGTVFRISSDDTERDVRGGIPPPRRNRRSELLD